jgi:hypothetical protein
MKTNFSLLVLSTFTVLFFGSCQREMDDLVVAPEEEAGKSAYTESSAVSPYAITLIGPTQQQNGNWVWIWKIQNTNPGNGNNGTVQGLSHWGFPAAAGGCFTPGSLVSAAYSTNGTSWTNFTPHIGVDPSASCISVPVLKFDFGTNGSAPTYYKLVVNRQFSASMVDGYIKSGKKTGCQTFQFMGISCSIGPS